MRIVLFDDFFSKQVLTYISDRGQDFTCVANNGMIVFKDQQKEYILKKSRLKKKEISHIASIRQVHGGRIVNVTRDYGEKHPLTEEADGLITNVPNYPLSIRIADCLPVFFYDDLSQSVGLVHAGWRGTQQKIVIEAIEKMGQEFKAEPKNIKVSFGPCLRPCCYRVGKEFVTSFTDNITYQEGQYYFNLVEANKGQLVQEGVLERNISDCDQCTCCRSDYFSYRREGKDAGRMICLIMLESRR